MRDTIKNHKDFFMTDSDPVALSPYFVVRAKMAKFPDDPRYGVMATKRTFKLAVQRNRAKRLLRDWIRFNADLMAPEYDYVFIAVLVYSLHVGINLHAARPPNTGDINF